MKKTYLEMKYHPAKKEVEFRRFDYGKETCIQGGRLQKYMNQKGQFVLQDHGNKFFDDIARAFDGIKNLEIQVITTKTDYEDFIQMVEYYNREPECPCQMTPTLIAELPDMKQTYIEVAKFGEQAIAALELHKKKLFDVSNISSESVKASAESFVKQIDKEIRNIREKIDNMSDNKVSLCVSGVYSAGKSALINAILGYKILPEKITSETAKMFQITSPKNGEAIKIIFEMDDVKTVLEWNDERKVMEFIQGPVENDERAEIQEKLNQLRENGKEKQEQMLELLKELNSMNAVSNDISIIFPIPLDNEAVQFTIYDTPGTDSNYTEHQEILMDALSEQKQSILIFVAAPNKTEGTGNNALLSYLKEAETKSSKTCIDIGRSLFVINWADSIDSDSRVDLQNEEIKYKKKGEDGKEVVDFSIKLSDKKLFFTSATYGYLAKAKRNGTLTAKEEKSFGRKLDNMRDEEDGCVYRQDKYATSELATERMQKQCEEALERAEEQKDDASVLEICSGLYALEQEIVKYGEKYASAVKAYAIINSVNKALSILSASANSLEESNKETTINIQKNIDELRETINGAIEEEYRKRTISQTGALPQETLKMLKLDSDSLQQEIIGNVQHYMDNELTGWFFGLGKVIYKESVNEKIRRKCDAVIDNYTTEFLKKRKEILDKEGKEFLKNVKKQIKENGKISAAAKEFFIQIPEPKSPDPEKIGDLRGIYEANKYTDPILIIKVEWLRKDAFMQDVKKKLLRIVESMGENYRKDYKDSLETILLQVKSDFGENLEKYSIYMHALIEDRNAMKELGQKVFDASEALRRCEADLNKIIWRKVINNG